VIIYKLIVNIFLVILENNKITLFEFFM
jgi:hypothetical protein